jgi:acetyl esterase/lipase
MKVVFPLFAWLQIIFLSSTAFAQQEWKPLWPEGAPGATGTTEHDIPATLAFPAPANKANGCTVLVCPGGGYGGLAMDHEGQQIASWMNERGIHAYILRYRLGSHGYHHPIEMNDVLRAMRGVRHDAEAAGSDPNRIGIMGFSAGGHLASTAATHFDAGDPNAKDPIDKISSRPNFAILCYPVITMDEAFTHKGSRRNLLGESNYSDAKLVELMSNEKQVTKDTPPTFIFHTTEDPAVPVENAIAFYSALRRNGVAAAELHIYQKGRHGVGLASNDPILSTWPDRLHAWMGSNDFLK